MKYREPLPSTERVHAALEQLRAEPGASRPISVLRLARHLAIPNTTLRRNYPEICAEITAAGHTNSPEGPGDTAYARLQRENAELRRVNRELSENLELAITNIQRLTIDNHRLTQALETASTVTRLTPRQHR